MNQVECDNCETFSSKIETSTDGFEYCALCKKPIGPGHSFRWERRLRHFIMLPSSIFFLFLLFYFPINLNGSLFFFVVWHLTIPLFFGWLVGRYFAAKMSDVTGVKSCRQRRDF